MTSLTRISLFARPEISTRKRKKKKRKTLQAFLTPHFSKKAPESQRWSTICQRSLLTWTIARRVSRRQRPESWRWKCLVSLLLIHVTLCFMLLTTKCENRTRNGRLEFQSGNDNKSVLEWVFKPAAEVLTSESWEVLQQENLEKPWGIITEETYWSLISAAALS